MKWGTTPRLHCPGEKSPSALLFTHLGLLSPPVLRNSCQSSVQPPSVLFSIMCFIYQTLGTRRSLCSCHSEIHQSDVIPLLPQQCNSPALAVLMDPLSSSCLWLWASSTGRGESGRELATREQWPVRMGFMRRKKQNKTPKPENHQEHGPSKPSLES